MLSIASWNVNSLKVRLDQVLDWFNNKKIDILALQETKLLDENFPINEFKNLGYHVVFSGQKTYNGVALLSRLPIEEVKFDIDELDDAQRRILIASIGPIRIINLYVPNGSRVGSEKYEYKLNWLLKVNSYLQKELARSPNLVVVGDFNIAPTNDDVEYPEIWHGEVLVSDKERQAFQKILAIGLYDSFRTLNPSLRAYTWWDYRAGSFRRNNGLRIDHILLSKSLMEKCKFNQMDIEPRRNARPSDHIPIWVEVGI